MRSRRAALFLLGLLGASLGGCGEEEKATGYGPCAHLAQEFGRCEDLTQAPRASSGVAQEDLVAELSLGCTMQR